MRYVVVKNGDILGVIALRVYGDFNQSDKIHDDNSELIQDTNQLRVGQKLRVPVIG